MKTIRLLFLVMAVFSIASQPAQAQTDRPLAMVMTIDATIMPSVQQYVERGMHAAEEADAEVLIIQLKTPGGDGQSMLNIMQAIRASNVPVIVYVAPRNAYALSAGAMITMAGHLAAMAPETSIGASSPVGGGGDLDPTQKEKATQAIKAAIVPLIERRPAKAQQLANDMIDKATAVTASEALEIGFVDFIADNIDDVLEKADGRTVETAAGTRILKTTHADVEELPMNLLEQILGILTNPNFIFLLTILGLQAIYIEISAPGGWAAGSLGVICLGLAAYGYGILPVNWFGALFIILAFVLFIIDISTPTHGALTAAGIASLIIGALILFNTSATPDYLRVSVPLVVGTSLAIGLLSAGLLAVALRAQGGKVQTGAESVVGKVGTARTVIHPDGQVFVHSEMWSASLAEGAEKIHKGDEVEVVAVEGLTLMVKKKK